MALFRTKNDKVNQEDLGLDRGGQKGRQRTINPDGSYNMVRINSLERWEIFHWLINASWTHFWIGVVLYYAIVNLIFATIYFLIGADHFNGVSDGSSFSQFTQLLFFSVQTYTTVGYGNVSPASFSAGLASSVEAFFGLMSFAIATGTLYGRFSKPTAKLKYSVNAIFAPFKDVKGLQFMVANTRSSNLMELEATVNFSLLEDTENGVVRKFYPLELEISKIAMLPTSWKVNHIIDQNSPLYELNDATLKEREAEVFILIRAFDDTFSQMIYSRHSYTSHDFIWGAKFNSPFHVNEEGKLVMNIDKVGEYTLTN
jgi:inward rectifier potassium channel